MAQNLNDGEVREKLTSGIIDVARQVRAADILEGTGMFELGDALDYGAQGMENISDYGQAKWTKQ